MARNIAELRVRGKLENQDYVNVLHFANDTLVSDGAFDPLLIALCEAYILCWVQHMLPILTPKFVLQSVSAKLIDPTVTDEVEVTTGAGPGQNGSVDDIPSFNSIKVEKRTGGGGRTGRGRMYLPPLPENRISGSNLDADGLTAVQGFIACIVGKFVGATKTSDWEIGVLSRKATVLPSTPDDRFRGIRTLVVSPEIAIMGRRKVGRGS